MQARTRQRLIRKIVASLMQSDLSAAELCELSSELKNGDFTRDVGRFLSDVRFCVEGLKTNKENRNDGALPDASIESVAVDIARRRRIPKRALAEMIEKV